MKKILSLFILVSVYTLCLAQAGHTTSSRSAKVIKVFDGDTFEVVDKDSTFFIRLFGIDAPERGQEFFEESKKYLETLVLGKEVLLDVKSTDIYKRKVAVAINAADGMNINYQMVRKGLAWHFTRYSNDPELAKLEAAARRKEIGIWSLFHYLEPWEYRKNIH